MVLPASPAHASPVEPHWFDKVVVAIELSAHGVLTLVDHAAPSRLREAYLRLRARDPETDLIVDVQRLAELSPGTTVILAMTPSISTDALDWLNLNRPLVADRRLNIVLWCESNAAAVLARGAPDFFDWISARVDCPPAPAAFAVADVKAAIRARAPGIAWAGPGLEETLAAVRPGRPIRRVAVASYQSMIDALTAREPGWLFLEGIDTEFHLRRLRWAMAETGRRVMVFRNAIACTHSDWWTVQAAHAPITDTIHNVIAAGGSGRVVALTGLDPVACTSVVYLLQQGLKAAELENMMAATAQPRDALEDLARPLSRARLDTIAKKSAPWMSAALQHALLSAAKHVTANDNWLVSILREQPLDAERWQALGKRALDLGDASIAIRWLDIALQSISDTDPPQLRIFINLQRGQAHYNSGDLAAARAILEQSHSSALQMRSSSLIASSAAILAETLLELGEPQLAREYLKLALRSDNEPDARRIAILLEALAATLTAPPTTPQYLDIARQYVEQALSIRHTFLPSDENFHIAASLRLLGTILLAQGHPDDARRHLQHSLELNERLFGPQHPEIAITLRTLARAQRDTGDLVGARVHIERALAIQGTFLGERHLETADMLLILSSLLAAAGEMTDAQATLERALSIQQKAFGGDGQLPGATTRRELAKVLAAKGDLTGAIENLQLALATQHQILERDDPDVVASERELARLQALQRDLQRPD
jgi:tetratricopeptide (TPR) repeat protein